MTIFAHALEHVLRHEAGYVDHPNDPGGATNMGITLATLRAWRGAPVTKADVRALTRDEAAAIYRKNYWDAARCGELPPAVGFLVFDGGVNHGVGQAVKFLQRAVGVADDGAIGPKTIAAAKARDAVVTVDEMAALRMVFYAELGTFRTFKRGWSRRLMAMHGEASRMTFTHAGTVL